MSKRTRGAIASRPSLEQIKAIVDFMEEHLSLGLGQLRDLEGREQSKKLWFKLTRVVNNIPGPTRPMKSWIKFWADKKSTVRSKVLSMGGDPNCLSSNIEKKIWDLFLANDSPKQKCKVEQDATYLDESFYNEESIDQNHVEDPVTTFEEPVVDPEEKNLQMMERLVKVMSNQALALSQLAQASQLSSQAMERLADASQIQARAIERLADSFETIGSSTQDIRNSIVEVDSTMKRYFSTSPS